MSRANGGGRTALLAFVISLAALLANGRAIGSGDTHAVERTAQAMVERGTVVLAEDGANDPFTRAVPGGRLSIYPALPALLAAPVLWLFRLLFDLSPAGLQVAGKLSAALLAAGAVGLMARSFTKRTSPSLALGSALVFGLGTSVYSTSQALWQHPAELFFLVAGLSGLEQVLTTTEERRLRPGLVAALGISLAAAARPAAIPMCAVLFLFLLGAARGHAMKVVAAAAVPASLVAVYNTAFFGAPWLFGPGLSGRFGAAFPQSLAGLLVSPARGLFVFTPLALLVMVQLAALARRQTLPRALLGAVVTHVLFLSTWNEWHGGESFGPRLMTDALPALFFFLPETLASWPKTGALLGLISVAVQAVGGWTYDYRWERLHQRGREFEAALWSWADSPVAFAVREGVLIQGVPEVDGRRIRLRADRFVPFGPEGSIIEASPTDLRISGAALVHDIRLERGARIQGGWITLAHPADALAFRSDSADARALQLSGSLRGVLRIETPSAQASVPVQGEFSWAVPLKLGAGDDVYVRAETGELRLSRVEIKREP